MDANSYWIEIRIGSALEYLDLVQTLSDCVTEFMGYDEDTAHWIGMSVRESVTNAIQHGNKLDPAKKVDIRFEVAPDQSGDHGQGRGEWLSGRQVAESAGSGEPA